MPRIRVTERELNRVLNLFKRNYPGYYSDVVDLVEVLRAKGLSIRRVIRYIYVLYNYLRWNGSLNLTRENVIRFLARLESEDYSEWTKAGDKYILRSYLRLKGREDLTKLIKVKEPRNNLQKSDLLTHEDIWAMLQVTGTMYRAMIMVGYETGARPSELMELRIKDLDIKGNYGYITIPMTKTETRTFPIFLCIPYVVEWLEKHPDPKPSSYLWYDNWGKPLQYEAYRVNLKRIMEKANVKTTYKKPYILRHTRITEMLKYLPSHIVKKMFGIKRDKTLEFYNHLAMQDVEEKLLSFYGEKPKNDDPYIKCRGCNTYNLPIQQYCVKCGRPLSKEAEIISYEALLEHKDIREEIQELREELREYMKIVGIIRKKV